MNLWERVKDTLKPQLCTHLCGKDLHRPHLGCLVCRERRWRQGKMDRSKYLLARNGHLVVPLNGSTYTIYIDGNRRFVRIKEFILDKLFSLAEFFAN